MYVNQNDIPNSNKILMKAEFIEKIGNFIEQGGVT